MPSKKKTTTKPTIVSIANQKGGVGKTTTAINLGAVLAAEGCSVLLLDLDPQGNASTGLGVDQGDRSLTMYDVVVEGADIQSAILETNVENLKIIPSTVDLSSADIELVDDQKRVLRLRARFDAWAQQSDFDYILIDCPPSLNLMTLNAFAASDSVMVPLQAEFFALEGLSQLMLTIKEVRHSLNPDLKVEGVVLTMFDGRNNLSTQVEADARENLGSLVYSTVIPRNVRLSEAPSFGMPATVYDPTSAGSMAYKRLGREFVNRQKIM